ncbi:MAG: hypothetical protein K9J85_11705 [Desulfobacteraceae bacterium]|nr:hypothetical protein [Desulfobacteraceae bacterium]
MISGPTSLAKITKPRTQKVLPRKRLFGLLDENCPFPATWICGPGGSGKTTLIASYIEHYQLPCLWYQIDESDSDISGFFYYMSLAGEKTAPQRSKNNLPLLTPEYASGISVFTRRFFEEIFDRLKKPGVLVLDNYQDVSRECQLHEILREALTVIPEGINVFILSRSQPPAALARARAGNNLHELGWNQLRFHPQETRDLIYMLKQKTCPETLADHLHKKTGGWVAGLILIMKRLEIEQLPAESFTQLIGDSAYDYFASEIFEDADPEIQNFFLKTSLFPEMTPRMAENLTGIENAENLLFNFHRNHWFTNRYTSSETRYQYHSMFRDFLLNRVSRTYPAPFLSGLKDKAAGLLKADGQLDSAVSLFLESGNPGQALDLILNHAQMMLNQGRIQTLEQLLIKLPPELFDKEPWLLYWLGACKLPSKPAEGKKLFEKALAGFEGRGNTAGKFLCLCGIIDSITYSADSFKLFDQWLPKLTALSNDFETLFSPELKGKVIFSLLQAMVLRQPDHPELKIWENRGLQILQSNAPADIKVQIILPLLVYHLFAGNMPESRYFIDVYRDLAQMPDVSPLARITLKDLEAYYYWLSCQFEECRNAVNKGLELASYSGIPVMSAYMTAHGAAGALSSGNIGGSAEYFRSIEAGMHQATGWIREMFHTMFLWKALLENDAPKALFHGKCTIESAEKTGCPLSTSFDYLGLALAFHASGKSKTGIKHLNQALSISKRIGSRQTEFACHLAEAEIALDSGDETGSLASLQKALAIGSSHQYLNTWFWRPEAMTRLCCKALEAGIEPGYVQKLIRKRDLIPDNPPVEIENWPWPIRIYTLGRFTLLKDGKPMGLNQKALKKPLLLLKTIISLGGRDISENQIADLLWPEAEGDAAHGSLKTTLHRLRKLLGLHDAVQSVSGRLSINHKYCWVDVWAFEHILSEADSLRNSGNRKKELKRSAELTQKALNLYHGRFLQFEDQVFPLREHLHERFLAGVKMLCNYLEEQKEWEKAIETYETGIKVDAVAEFCYQKLMICNHQLGRKTEILSTYNKCRDSLSANLGLRPSPATEALRESLLSGNEK